MENNIRFLTKLSDRVKADLKGKFIASNTFVLKNQDQSTGIISHLKTLENITKETRKKEISKIKVRINDIKSKSKAERMCKSKSHFLEKGHING